MNKQRGLYNADTMYFVCGYSGSAGNFMSNLTSQRFNALGNLSRHIKSVLVPKIRRFKETGVEAPWTTSSGRTKPQAGLAKR